MHISRSHYIPLRTLDAHPVAYILHTLCGVPESGNLQSHPMVPMPGGSHLNRPPHNHMAGVNAARWPK